MAPTAPQKGNPLELGGTVDPDPESDPLAMPTLDPQGPEDAAACPPEGRGTDQIPLWKME